MNSIMQTKTDAEIQILDWTQAKPLAEVIRRRVFIEEQQVPESEEWDRWDSFAVHVLAIRDGQAIGTARLTREGKIGRMAVLPGYRGRGIGQTLLLTLLDVASERGMQSLALHAQTHAVDFYARHGFEAEGEEFMEAGIPHLRMVRAC